MMKSFHKTPGTCQLTNGGRGLIVQVSNWVHSLEFALYSLFQAQRRFLFYMLKITAQPSDRAAPTT